MGNCLACFQGPQLRALDDATVCKEGMPIAESQFPLANNTNSARTGGTSLLSDSDIVSNGNHLPLHRSEQDLQRSSVTPSNVTRLYSSYQQKRYQTKSAPIMGLTESKPSDMKIAQLFENYKDDQEDSILAEGIEQLCRDLQLSPDEFKVLILAWKLNAGQMCKFTRLEFVNGLIKMRVDTLKGVQMCLPEYVKEVSNDGEQFKDLYRFTFKFGLESGLGQRILPSDMAISLWKLVFTIREPPILQRWLRFLENHPTIRGIPRDTWNMFLNFSETVNNDLSTYDDNEAWPSLFDDFVEYENDQTNQNVAIKSKDGEKMLFESFE